MRPVPPGTLSESEHIVSKVGMRGSRPVVRDVRKSQEIKAISGYFCASRLGTELL